MKPNKTPPRGFPVACPACGDADTLVANLSDTSNIACSSCDTKFAAASLRKRIVRMVRVLEWLETAPLYVEAPR